jgi:hypothetical protein
MYSNLFVRSYFLISYMNYWIVSLSRVYLCTADKKLSRYRTLGKCFIIYPHFRFASFSQAKQKLVTL